MGVPLEFFGTGRKQHTQRFFPSNAEMEALKAREEELRKRNASLSAKSEKVVQNADAVLSEPTPSR